MNAVEIQEHLESLDDAQLKTEVEVATQALMEAAESQPNSEWHESCYAAVLIFVNEMNRRNISATTIH